MAVTGALRSDALDALGRSRSPLVLRGSPLAPGVRVRAKGARPSVAPDAPNASEDADELADDGPERACATRLAWASARMLNADGARENAARGERITSCARARHRREQRRIVPRACVFFVAGADARRTGVERAVGTSVAAARAQLASGLTSGTLSMLRTSSDLRSALAETALALKTPLAVESVEYTELSAGSPAPARRHGLRRTALSVPAPAPAAAPEEGLRQTSSAALRRRVSGLGGLGVSSSSELSQSSNVVSPSPPRRRAAPRASLCSGVLSAARRRWSRWRWS
jgi:hypothetical protein